MVLSELRAHIGAWASSLGSSVTSEWREAAEHLANWIEGKQAEADAVQLLQSKGYTITPPQQ